MSTTHRQANGETILIKDMEDQHLLNTINLLYKKAERGVTVSYGGGVCAEDIWYDEETLFGDEAIAHMGLEAYIKEARRRGIPTEEYESTNRR